mmetsp:Transcript_83167/g.156513  ORF Transcript_83167/g.156513 Transcript_83167/m.156513 type:complete len:129 (-) Transcript_83167:167-553(-)
MKLMMKVLMRRQVEAEVQRKAEKKVVAKREEAEVKVKRKRAGVRRLSPRKNGAEVEVQAAQVVAARRAEVEAGSVEGARAAARAAVGERVPLQKRKHVAAQKVATAKGRKTKRRRDSWNPPRFHYDRL